MKRIQSKKHKLRTCEIDKISLSCFDDERYVLDDGIHTLNCFHKNNIKSCNNLWLFYWWLFLMIINDYRLLLIIIDDYYWRWLLFWMIIIDLLLLLLLLLSSLLLMIIIGDCY